MRLKLAWLISSLALMAACNTHVQDPWVQDEDYLKQERNRAADTADQLDRRISAQRDR